VGPLTGRQSLRRPNAHDFISPPASTSSNVTYRHALVRRSDSLIVAAVVMVAVLLTPGTSYGSDTSTRWDSFSESSSCGDPFTRGPFASKRGYLSNTETILGPFGTYFGRSIAEIRTKLRYWTVPQSGGLRVPVHVAMLPSLQKVAESLNTHAAQGRIYRITSVGAFVPRTIGDRHQVSRHALGLAIDLNPAQNPYREDGVLITNMPGWFVAAWKDAGFCWGGDWIGVKDPMHFSWMGPGSTPWDTDSLEPTAPHTSKTSFGGAVANHVTEFASVMTRYSLSVVDGTGNGTSDVVGLRSHPEGAVIDIASSALGFGKCSIGRWFVPDTSVDDADLVVFADVDGDSGQDLVALTIDGGLLDATVATRRERFKDPTESATGLGADAAAVVGADFDDDHIADLWEATPDGRLKVWRGPNFTQLISDSVLPAGAPLQIAAGDRDGGNTPELYALYPNGGGSRIDVLTFGGSWSKETSVTVNKASDSIAAIGAGDYDGDGRADAQVLVTSGQLLVYIGNSSTGIPYSRWFLNPDWECENLVLLDYTGTFMDDDDSIFTLSIESIAAVGVTKGCNPPFNDKFCPSLDVTREQMAAFLVRALGLTDNTHSGFTDVPAGSTFANDIGKLATAGITKGCNPPANTKFCPKDHVSREQMAAFMARALQLTDNTHSGFTDVAAGSTFASDIGKLATAGITKGCNPPANDEFCPTDSVTREQMAAFLDRAGLGS